MSIESQRYDVNGIIKSYSDKMGSGILELWGKYLQEIIIKAGRCPGPRVLSLVPSYRSVIDLFFHIFLEYIYLVLVPSLLYLKWQPFCFSRSFPRSREPTTPTPTPTRAPSTTWFPVDRRRVCCGFFSLLSSLMWMFWIPWINQNYNFKALII